MKRLLFFFDDFCDLIFSNLSWLMLGDSIDVILYKNLNRESIWIQYKVQNQSIWYARHDKSGHYLVWYRDGWNPFRGRMIRHKPIPQCRNEPNFPWIIPSKRTKEYSLGWSLKFPRTINFIQNWLPKKTQISLARLCLNLRKGSLFDK